MKKLLKGLMLLLAIILSTSALTLNTYAQVLDAGIPVEEYPDLFLTRSLPTHGEGRVLVFLIQFPDMQNQYPDGTAEYYNKLYFSEEPFSKNSTDPTKLSVSKFYEAQSFGKLKLTGEVMDWYTAKHERDYYSTKKKELIEEAAEYHISRGKDLSDFDANNDGVIDACVFHFAGDADTSQKKPWYGGVKFDGGFGASFAGKKLTTVVQVSSEVNVRTDSLDLKRTICHELLHVLGLFDLYGEVWLTLDIGSDLMNKNDLEINPYYKMLLGWTKSVTLVTSDTRGIRLNDWDDHGETFLVTDSYNGVFDEFYMITYKVSDPVQSDEKGKPAVFRVENNEIRIWHIDARLNEQKTGFLYDNLRFTPNPEDGDAHSSSKKVSSCLFIEEVSSLPTYDSALNKSKSDFFREGSSLAPNSLPSSDTHSGRCTGIRIDNFKRYDDHATADITFNNKDTSAPRVSEELSSVGFSDKNKLRFNEHVYAAAAWSGIKVTDMKGKSVAAEILKSTYPANEIKINFTNGAPTDGYRIVLPEGCVADSSGNKNKAETVTVEPTGRVFPESKELIPWYYEGKERRWETNSECFSYEGDSIVITTTGEGDEWVSFIEFVKVDGDGKLIAHKFIKNPYTGTKGIYSIQTKDGGYVITGGSTADFAIRIDKNGELLWHRQYDYTLNSGILVGDRIVYTYCLGANGRYDDLVFLDPASGSITATKKPSDFVSGKTCYNGTDVVTVKAEANELIFYKTDPVTFSSTELARQTIDGATDFMLFKIKLNGNGSCLIFGNVTEESGTRMYMALTVDPSFGIMKKLVIPSSGRGMLANAATFFDDDGFIAINVATEGEHSNDVYHVVRADKNLNIMWETDIDAAHLDLFVTSKNKVFAFATLFQPRREAFLLGFGSEDAFEKSSHSLAHAVFTEATCEADGNIEHWKCLDCGKLFSDSSAKTETSENAVRIPKVNHVMVPCDEVAPTCTEDGYTGGTWCAFCKGQEQGRTVVKATGHLSTPYEEIPATCKSKGYTGGTYCKNCNLELTKRETLPIQHHIVPYEEVPATCTESGFTGGRYCDACGREFAPRKITPPKNHRPVATPRVEATCTEDGSVGGRHCSVCNEVIEAPVPIKAKGHSSKKYKEVKPTCTENGYTGGTYCSVCGDVLTERTVIEAAGHSLESYRDVNATCTEDGYTGGAFCTVCGEVTEQRTLIKALGHKAETDAAVAPTYFKEGISEGSHCSVCGITLVAQQAVAKLKLGAPIIALIIAVPLAAAAAVCAIAAKRKRQHSV